MLPSWYFGLSAAMGLLFSPDHLRLWGNLAGSSGSIFWLAVLCASFLFFLTAISYRHLSVSAGQDGNYFSALHQWGGKPAIALMLSSRLVLLLGMSSGVLVTAGFVFNETFAYWFPNFAFAFALLGAVAAIHSFGYRTARKFQFGLLIVIIASLAFMIGAGFLRPGPYPVTASGNATGTVPTIFSAALLLFVGCDLNVHRTDRKPVIGQGPLAMLAAIGITAAILSLWGTVSLMHVPADRLSESFIPFTLAARQISGQTGRALMGIVVIAGTICAVVTLFSAASHQVTALAEQKLLPRFLSGSKQRNIPATIIWATFVAALMALGSAGSPSLEVFIRAGFILWLLHLILVHLLAASRKVCQTDLTVKKPWHHHYTWASIPTALFLMVGAGCLWMIDEQRNLLSLYITAAWFGAMTVLFFAHWGRRLKEFE